MGLKSVLSGIAVLVSVVSIAWHAPAAPMYTITDLGVLPGHCYSEATGINGLGQVAGTSGATSGGTLVEDSRRGFVWTATAGLKSVGVLPGDRWSESVGVSDNHLRMNSIT
jgi:uncharacterized membrane protein